MNGLTALSRDSLDELGLELPFANAGAERFDAGPGETPIAEWFDEAFDTEVAGTKAKVSAHGARRLKAATPNSAPGLAPAAQPNRMCVRDHPMLRSHRGTQPDLILRWNDIGDSDQVDVVVHFHGFSAHGGDMDLVRDKETCAGLDFTDPRGSGAPGRTRPTLAILPRGDHTGGVKYKFPALIKPGALQQLVQDGLERLGRQTGRALRQGRLILTAHSGGGAAVSAILTYTDPDPDEVHIFDGMYGSGANVIRWAQRCIARELADPGALAPALRILYRPRTKHGPQTESESLAVAHALCGALQMRAGERLRARFRVDRTLVEHNDIPGRFGWRLLADAGADLPDAKSERCRTSHETEGFTDEASASWETAANEREESQRETYGAEHEDHLDAGAAFESEEPWAKGASRDDEDLAWLDFRTSGEEQESESFEPEAEWSESYAQEESEYEERDHLETNESPASAGATATEVPYADQHEALADLAELLEKEAGMDPGLAGKVQGIAAFVLGPTLRQGSHGGGAATLQRFLVKLGADVAVNGKFGSKTAQAVRNFQAGSGLTVNGVVGPRTKAAIAAALGSTAPAPAPSGPKLGDAIARIAEQECKRWHPPTGDLRETDSAASPILQQYYREGVDQSVSPTMLQDKAWQKQHPWSAVFVSWVMRTAGAGAGFTYATAHQTYIRAARRNRLERNPKSPFWAYRADEIAPQVGDLICASREGSGATYDNIAGPEIRATHCDIVTAIHPGSLRVIGGNVHDNVDRKTIRTRADGHLSLDADQARFFAIVRCRGSAESIAPPPTPPAPAGKRLTPARFVAAFGPSARSSQAAHGVPALVTLGQAALESGWGEHAPRFNFFGIKAKASDPEPTRQLLRTREVFPDRNRKFPEIISITPRPDGKFDYVVRDWFRAFADAATAFDSHGEFLLRNKRYAKAFTVAADPYAFAAEVARAGYATDPSYGQVLTSVMRTIEAAGGP